MTFGYNYKLIYAVRKNGIDCNSESNRLNSAQNAAAAREQESINKDKAILTRLLGHSRFEFTNIVCCADGINCHVYTWEDGLAPRDGIGEKTCIFCGLDDFDI